MKSALKQDKYYLMLKALGDPTRLKIFDMLKSGEKCACVLLEEFEITQPTLSYHMQMLVDSELVISTKQGKWCHYSLNTKLVDELAAYLLKVNFKDNKCNCKI
jgi:ArsR family transcriptional regulator, arsenate/arsenite/antimonite-responsive transcriptional repressor